MTDEDRKELLRIALFCSQELSAALTEIDETLKCERLDWLKSHLFCLVQGEGLDPDKLGIDSMIRKT